MNNETYYQAEGTAHAIFNLTETELNFIKQKHYIKDEMLHKIMNEGRFRISLQNNQFENLIAPQITSAKDNTTQYLDVPTYYELDPHQYETEFKITGTKSNKQTLD